MIPTRTRIDPALDLAEQLLAAWDAQHPDGAGRDRAALAIGAHSVSMITSARRIARMDLALCNDRALADPAARERVHRSTDDDLRHIGALCSLCGVSCVLESSGDPRGFPVTIKAPGVRGNSFGDPDAYGFGDRPALR